MFGDPVTNSKNWPIKRLSTLIKEGDSINYGVVQPGDDYDDGVPLIRAGDVVSGKIFKDNLKKIDPKIEANYKRSRLLGSEILVSCVGSIGSVMLADPSMKGFNIARAVARISPTNIINRIYLAEYLKCLRVQRYFTAELRTVSQPTLNIKQICETEILYPPIDFQIKFEKIMNVIDKERRAFNTSSHEFLSLISSLQNQAFTTGFRA
jgi:type I restriction enzyme S subunit